MQIRSLVAADARAARELVEAAVSHTPYGGLPRLALERALRADSDESLALVAAEGGAPVGIVLYGLVAGARGAGKLHFLAGSHLAGLLPGAAADLRRRGARLIVAEVPDDAAVRAWRVALEEAGFVLEGRVGDYHRDGVDLLLLRRDL